MSCRGYINRNLLPTYGMCRSDGHVSIKKVTAMGEERLLLGGISRLGAEEVADAESS